jgi:hypothetical protein
MKDGEFEIGQTRYGFTWGPVSVERVCSDKTGVYFYIATKKNSMNIRITPGGKIVPGYVEKTKEQK